ncbi:MAG TPA: PQQ-dependent sugar dehydrogenase, partial [Gammaproteobacteria bacterium]|nr:PQQ-dependent sugar dehydrogenase [Gammaproteobacteria bacterium]
MPSLLAAWLVAPTGHAAAEKVAEGLRTEYEPIRVVRIADGLEHPWAVAVLPDGRFLVSERSGRLNLLADGVKTRVAGLPEIHAHRQGGLLDVVLHPDFTANGWVYITYSQGDAAGTTTALGRGRLEGDALVGFEEL